MKSERSKTKRSTAEREQCREWLRLAGLARMQVWASGGPLHAGFERLAQLAFIPRKGGDESWTIYRSTRRTSGSGKVVHKKWYRETDLERFDSAQGKRRAAKPTIIERQFPVPDRWLRTLERAVESTAIPLITGRDQSFSFEAVFEMSFWRGGSQAKFSWGPTPPKAWRPLGRIFFQLLRVLRQHEEGQLLTPIESP